MDQDDDPADGEKHHDPPAEPHNDAENARTMAVEILDAILGLELNRPENLARFTWKVEVRRQPVLRRSPSARSRKPSA